jgi:hypothetical protein
MGRNLLKVSLISLVEVLFVGSMVLIESKMYAATTPAEWNLLVDKTNNCQISVPSDWKVSAFSPSIAVSPDNKLEVQMDVTNLGKTLREFKVTAERIYPPIKIFEDSKSRLWFSYKNSADPEGSRMTYYLVGIPAKENVCAAQISFESGKLAPVAKQIAGSLVAAK